jgi:hypothetical protein
VKAASSLFTHVCGKELQDERAGQLELMSQVRIVFRARHGFGADFVFAQIDVLERELEKKKLDTESLFPELPRETDDESNQ